MNTHALRLSTMALSFVALCGCGQPYSPESEAHTADPRGAGDVFESNPDTTRYQTVSYEILRSWLVTTLHMPETVAVGGACAPAQQNECPIQAPVPYLDANKGALGIPVFTADPDGTQVPSLMTSGGFKVWIVAASSSCGLAAQNPATVEELFPAAEGGLASYDRFYGTLLGRTPSDAERAELDLLQGAYSDDVRKMAAVCTTVLASLENLAAN